MMTITPPSSAKSPPPAAHPLPPRPIPKTARVLAALIKKELRQHTASMLLLFLVAPVFCLLAILALGLFAISIPNPLEPHEALNFLVHPDWELTSPLIFPFIGFFIGARQAWTDRHFGLWSFLIHHPVSRSLQFFARTAAGLILCLATAGMLLAVVLFIAYETAEFFDWRFTLPSIADCCVGIVYYFAGLLTVSRAAHFYGSKFIPCIAAAACSIVVIFAPSFSLAVLFIFLFIALFSTAAWGSALSHGFRLPVPAAARLVLNFILLLSFALLITGALISISPLVQGFSLLNRPEVPTQGAASGETGLSYILLRDGSVAKAMRLSDGTQQYFDLAGHEVPAALRPPDTGHYPPDLGYYPDQERAMLLVRGNDEQPFGYRDYRRQIHLFTVPLTEWNGVPNVPRERWYYFNPEGRFYGYDVGTGRFLGTIGQNGFALPGSTTLPFSFLIWHDPEFPHATAHALYNINLETRKVEASFTPPEGERILGANYLTGDSATGDEIIRTTHHLYLLTPGAEPIKFPLEPGFENNLIGVNLFRDTKRISFMYFPYPQPSATHWIVATFEISDGKQIAEYDLPRFNKPSDIPPSTENLPTSYVHATAAVAGVYDAMAGPIVASPLSRMFLGFGPTSYEPEHRTPFAAVADQTLRHEVTWILLIFAAIGTFSIARIYRARFSLIWTLLTFVFGPAAMLALIAAHRLPVRATCPTCHKRRPVGEARCPHCGAAFTSPPRDGIEVFAVSPLA